MSKPRIKKCVFPVAGLGTRFLPATKVLPKEMLPIVDKPLIQLAVEEAFASGIETCILVTRRGKSLMIDHFDFMPELERILAENQAEDKLALVKEATPPPSRVVSVRQQASLGLGHAIGCAFPFLDDEPFAVILPDDFILADRPCLSQMLEAWEKVGGNLVATQEVTLEETANYGILDVASEEGALISAKGMVEKPRPGDAPSRHAIIGRYVLDPAVLKAIQTTKPDKNGEVQITDAMMATLPEIPFHGLRFAGRRFDCGRKLGYLEANIAYAFHQPKLKARLLPVLKAMIEEAKS